MKVTTKKCIALLTLLTLIVGLLPTYVSATNGKYASVADKQVKVGEDVVIEYKATKDMSIDSIAIYASFDNTALETSNDNLTFGTFTGAFTDGGIQADGKTMNATAVSGNVFNVKAGDLLFSIKFKTLKAGESTISTVVNTSREQDDNDDFDETETITAKVTAIREATEVKLNKTATTLEEGSSETLTAEVLPQDTTDKTLTWESSNTEVATVDSRGTVTAVKEGTAEITAKTTNNITATCTVTVSKYVCKHPNITTIQAKKATCTEAGNNEYQKCDDCGKIFKADPTALIESTLEAETIKALGHDFSVYQHDENQHWNKCSRCDATDTKVNHVGEGEYLSDATNHWKICGCGVKVEEEAHTPNTPVKENIHSASCTAAGDYVEVVYCSKCNYEMSRERKTEKAKGHTPNPAVKENIHAASCTEEGTYDEVIYCNVCGEKISTTPKTEKAKGHTAGEPVKENIVPSTHLEKGTYDEVTYCRTCNAEMSRVKKDSDLIPHDGTGIDWDSDKETHWKICGCGTKIETGEHTEAEPVNENIKAPTCTEAGSHDEVVYCSVCNYELSRANKVDKATGHTEAEPVNENVKAPTCTKEGSHDEVVYCSVCKKELSRTNKVDKATGHKEGKVAVENEIEATVNKEGSYDEVIYCSVCNEEISRTAKTTPKFVYEILDGARSTHVKYDGTTITIRANGKLSKFKDTKVDGNLIDKANYTTKEGSTIVTFNTNYLDTLSVGEHTMAFVYDDGEVGTTFTIIEKAKEETTVKNNPTTPKTDDMSNMALWIVGIAISGILFVTVLGCKIKGSRKKARH